MDISRPGIGGDFVAQHPRTLVIRTAQPEPVYDSFDGAVTATKESFRHREAEATTALVRKRVIRTIRCGDNELTLSLDNGSQLTFFAKNGIACHLLNRNDALPLESNVDALAPMVLYFDKSPDPCIWDRRTILAPLIGLSIVCVSASATWTFLGIRDVPGWRWGDEMMFSAHEITPTAEPFLFYGRT